MAVTDPSKMTRQQLNL